MARNFKLRWGPDGQGEQKGEREQRIGFSQIVYGALNNARAPSQEVTSGHRSGRPTKVGRGVVGRREVRL